MVAPAVEGIDLFKIAGRSISGWIPSLKTGTTLRQPFCSQLEERLMLWLEYHPQVKNYARGDIGPQFATTYRLPTPKHAPFAIGYMFEDKPHHYLPDVVGTLTDGKPFIAEAGMEDDKRGDRNLAKAEAARRLARLQRGVFWIGTERTLTKRRHYNLVFLHARRKTFPAFGDIAEAVQEVWPWGEMPPVCEVASRLEHKFPIDLVEAAIWKVVGDSAAQGHLLVDLEQFTLDRTLPLALLPPGAPPLVPDPLPDTLLPEPVQEVATISRDPSPLVPGPTFDASRLPEPQREQFHRNLRAVSQVLSGATQTSVAEKEGIPRSTLGRLVRRTRQLGQIACVPHGSYTGKTTMHPAFAECIRRLFLLPTQLSMTAIREHTEMQQVAARLSKDSGSPVKLPSYKQVRTTVQHLKMEPDQVLKFPNQMEQNQQVRMGKSPNSKRPRKTNNRTRRKRWKQRKNQCKRAHYLNARFLERWLPSISNDLRLVPSHRWNVLTVEERVRFPQSRVSSGSLRTTDANYRPL